MNTYALVKPIIMSKKVVMIIRTIILVTRIEKQLNYGELHKQTRIKTDTFSLYRKTLWKKRDLKVFSNICHC